MVDVATLGLEVHSDQVKRGAADLDRLTAAAKKAEAAAAGVAGASDKAAKATANISTATGKARIQWETYDEVVARTGTRIKGAAKVADDAAKSVSKQAGAAQEAASKATGYGNAVEQAGRKTERASIASQGFALALGKVRQALVSIALNAISVGVGILLGELLKLVDWASLAKKALDGLAWAVENLTPYLLGAAGTLALIYAPAILSGIGTVTVAVATLGATALRAAASFTAAWLAAMGPAGWFILGLAAITSAAVIFRDELTQIFGVDIVGVAKDAVNAVVGYFVGAYDGVVAAWNLLPAALGDLGYQAANRFYATVTAMLRSLRAEINSFIEGINTQLGTAIPTIGGGLIGLNPDGTQRSIPNPYAGSASGAGEAFQGAFDAAQGKDYVGATYEAIAKGASAAADKIRELAASFGNVEGASGRAGKAAKDAAKGATDQWKGLRDTVDKTAEAAMKFARDVVGGFVSDLRSGLEQGKSFWRAFGDAALNVLDKIVDKLLNDVIDALFQVNSASSGTGGGGFLGGLLGGIGKLFGFAKGGYTGPGAASQPAGIVHAGEYVFSKKAVDRIGVGYLDRAHKAAKGYMGGGFVSRMHSPANSNLRGYDVGGYVTPTPQYHGNAAVAQGREVIEVVLRDDSGRMAEIADQQIQKRSGAIVQMSVQQSVKSVRGQMSGMIAEAQTRKL